MIRLYDKDCRELLRTMDAQVDMVLTSPPYDDTRNYNHTNNWNFDIFKEIAQYLVRVLKPGGVIVWVVGDKTNKGSETGSSFRQALYFKDLGLNLHDTMIYRKINYVPLTHNRYEQEFEYMFCFSKGKPKTFNPIKVPCKYAGTTTWGKASFYKTSDDKLVKVGTKVVHDTKIKGNIFEYRTGSTNETKKYKHPAMFPLQLAKDQIKSWTNEEDWVLDPFMGAGTVGAACKELGRNFIGCEIVDKYFDMCVERLM